MKKEQTGAPSAPLTQSSKSASKVRLDKLLLEQGLVQSRERAQALILQGRVLVDGQKIEKAGTAVSASASVRLLGEEMPYVSRGGLKLQRALEHWRIDLNGRACVDVGASTGGFTDCMLQHGARSVLAIDTGYGQIAMKLRSESRVSLMERTNARMLEEGSLPDQIQFLAMDVSFISATLVLPAVRRAARGLREAVVLIKPQFESGREHVGKGGIVRDERAHQLAVERVKQCASELGGFDIEVIDSPIKGSEGNKEFLLHVRFCN